MRIFPLHRGESFFCHFSSFFREEKFINIFYCQEIVDSNSYVNGKRKRKCAHPHQCWHMHENGFQSIAFVGYAHRARVVRQYLFS